MDAGGSPITLPEKAPKRMANARAGASVLANVHKNKQRMLDTIVTVIWTCSAPNRSQSQAELSRPKVLQPFMMLSNQYVDRVDCAPGGGVPLCAIPLVAAHSSRLKNTQ